MLLRYKTLFLVLCCSYNILTVYGLCATIFVKSLRTLQYLKVLLKNTPNNSRAGVVKWYTSQECSTCGHIYRYVDQGSNRLSCHVDLCTVSNCHTRGVTQDRHHQKEHYWPHIKDLCPTNNSLKKKGKYTKQVAISNQIWK